MTVQREGRGDFPAPPLPAPAPAPAPICLSPQGELFIEREEGFRAQPYNDSQGHATIGVGHLISYGPVTDSIRKQYGTWSLADALLQLGKDAERNGLVAIRQNVKVPLETNEIDALTSLCFNCGPGALRATGSVCRAVNRKPATNGSATKLKAWRLLVSAAFMLWSMPPELIPRRRREVALFCAGKYT